MSCAIALGVASALGLGSAFGIPAAQGFLVTSDRFIVSTAPPMRGLGIAARDGTRAPLGPDITIPMGRTIAPAGTLPLGGEVCP
jgi:hypothetical protein